MKRDADLRLLELREVFAPQRRHELLEGVHEYLQDCLA